MMPGTASTPRLRLGVLGLVVVSLFAVMLSRLWYLQVIASPTFQVQAENNRVRLVPEAAIRGRILDRNGNVVVDNKVSNVVAISRGLLKDEKELDVVLTRLAPVLNVPKDELHLRATDTRTSPYRPVPLAENVDERVIVYVKEHGDDFPGVEAGQFAIRDYPNSNLGSHLMGYVGEINDKELKQLEGSGYRLGDEIGKSGIEKVYDRVLRGTPGVEKLEVDAEGRVIRSLGYQPPVPGKDVKLTVDLEVQRVAEESLRLGIEAARNQRDGEEKKLFVAPAGSVVVLDPQDGSVLALASYPDYDPSQFVGGIKPDVFRQLNDPANRFPLNNRALQGQYAPGSTFKLVTSIAGLRSGKISPRTTITDSGRFNVPNCRGTKCTFRNAGGRSWGRVNLPRALTVSSDVYYYTLGARFWIEGPQTGIQDVARDLGFGSRTGIPLPFEANGRVSDADTRRRLHEENPKAFPNGRWFTGDNVNMAIGQGELAVTPLQLANAYAAFANGGTVYTPRVAQAFPGYDQRAAEELRPAAARKVTIDPDGRAAMMAGLRGAITSGDGTAATAFAGFPHDRLEVAGKTGTAQVLGKQDTALFVALAGPDLDAVPAEYVVGVVLEEAGFGGQTAAPVARRILERIAGVEPGPIGVGSGVD